MRITTAALHIKHDSKPIEIVPNLYIGSIGAALNKKLLNELGITHILCTADNVKPAFGKDFVYKTVSIFDGPDTDIKAHFEECASFIDAALNDKKKVLVHCLSGRSRSATIIAAYLIKTRKISHKDAIILVKSKRSVVKINFAFVDQLEDYENEILKKNTPASLLRWMLGPFA
eukprot:CAMPEP_0176444530 /NCGR_PEP_ID=MMETSP0127-20121128/23118_1 /TAXON_ID=938130 /ORGANISM="Platyophrya macrostoma, Strain WH" /LENGTH=172 /DNA_ID=CAMNT_0017830057 /DNA_START=11 /DNA_END=525 /DNA_ORIENTATION=-